MPLEEKRKEKKRKKENVLLASATTTKLLGVISRVGKENRRSFLLPREGKVVLELTIVQNAQHVLTGTPKITDWNDHRICTNNKIFPRL